MEQPDHSAVTYALMKELRDDLKETNKLNIKVNTLENEMKNKVSEAELVKALSEIKVQLAKYGVIFSIILLVITAIVVKAMT